MSLFPRQSHIWRDGIWAFVFAFVVWLPASADEPLCSGGDTAEESSACSKVGTWSVSVALGAGIRQNPVVGQNDLPLVLLPKVHYYGKRFSLENYNLGYMLASSKHHEFNLVTTLSFEHMFFSDFSIGNFALEDGGSTSFIPPEDLDTGDSFQPLDSPSIREDDVPAPAPDIDDLHDRNLAALAGVEYSFFYGPVHLGVQALHDISHVHQGEEVRAAVTYSQRIRRNHFGISAGVLWKSANAMDYYYGVRYEEVFDPRLAYQAEADSSYFAKLNWSRPLSERWSLVGMLYHRILSDEAANSPLVDRDAISSVYLGGVYHF